jgi:hypothetical protein
MKANKNSTLTHENELFRGRSLPNLAEPPEIKDLHFVCRKMDKFLSLNFDRFFINAEK